MLISEVRGWRYFISWDNPQPADSSSMLKDLERLGKVKPLETKTSVVLSPKRKTTYHHVREAIKKNLSRENLKTGKAFYVNLRSGQGFEIGKSTKWKWRYPVGVGKYSRS